MLNEYVTEDVFKKGLTTYLNKHRYSNAKTVDLWNAISDVSPSCNVYIYNLWRYKLKLYLKVRSY